MVVIRRALLRMHLQQGTRARGLPTTQSALTHPTEAIRGQLRSIPEHRHPSRTTQVPSHEPTRIATLHVRHQGRLEPRPEQAPRCDVGELHPPRVLLVYRLPRPREEGDRTSVCALLGEDKFRCHIRPGGAAARGGAAGGPRAEAEATREAKRRRHRQGDPGG